MIFLFTYIIPLLSFSHFLLYKTLISLFFLYFSVSVRFYNLTITNLNFCSMEIDQG